MRVAAYIRPWSRHYFDYLLREAFPSAEPLLVSDFRNLGDYDLSARFYACLRGNGHQTRCPNWLSANDQFEIIARNYLLRSLSLEKARLLVRAMSWSIEGMLDDLQPNAIIAPTVDSYVMDLLFRHSKQRGIPFCGLISCPIPGYTRVTAIGEFVSFRDVSNEECERSVARIMDPAFRPIDLTEWLKMYGSNMVHLKRSLRELPKRYVFPLIGRWRRDVMNYHYLASARSSVSFVSQALLIERFFETGWQELLGNWTGTKVYLPLQAFPEATTDYHVAELDLIDFPALLPRVLGSLTSHADVLVCVKEHPGMMGARPPGFYDQLRNHRNVVLISGDVPASAVIDATDLVLTWTGTGGLEAALRGKPVITIGKPYYGHGPLFRNITSLNALDALAKVVDEMRGVVPPVSYQTDLARHVLTSTFSGEFRFINFDPSDASLRDDANALAAGLRASWASWSAAFLDRSAARTDGSSSAVMSRSRI